MPHSFAVTQRLRRSLHLGAGLPDALLPPAIRARFQPATHALLGRKAGYSSVLSLWKILYDAEQSAVKAYFSGRQIRC